jgi:hypothetical protein
MLLGAAYPWFCSQYGGKIYRAIKKSLHLMITIQNVTSIVQSVPRQSVEIY